MLDESYCYVMVSRPHALRVTFKEAWVLVVGVRESSTSPFMYIDVGASPAFGVNKTWLFWNTICPDAGSLAVKAPSVKALKVVGGHSGLFVKK